jgi:bifunctional UDP-N-acetylglucosamine pyrophosphorylase/glucosamine-1-phosphate N-acetyltransferase
MIKNELHVVILAAGHGKRMESTIPKVLHLVHSKPMIVRVVEQVLLLNPSAVTIVVNGEGIKLIQDTIMNYCGNCYNFDYVVQSVPQGTGHAIQCVVNSHCCNYNNRYTMIINADTPMITYATLKDIYDNFLCSVTKGDALQIVGIRLSDPKSNGRIIVTGDKIRIVEDKDCDDLERLVTLVNTGIYVIDYELLKQHIMSLTNNNNQGEYYLTDIVAIAAEHNANVILYVLPDDRSVEIYNVNNKMQLAMVNSL